MPEVLSIGLGGGSIVQIKDPDSKIQVGPLSVGSRLTQDSQCCNGAVLTATDAAVKTGVLQDFGNPDMVKANKEDCKRILDEIKNMVENLVDKIKVNSIQ